MAFSFPPPPPPPPRATSTANSTEHGSGQQYGSYRQRGGRGAFRGRRGAAYQRGNGRQYQDRYSQSHSTVSSIPQHAGAYINPAYANVQPGLNMLGFQFPGPVQALSAPHQSNQQQQPRRAPQIKTQTQSKTASVPKPQVPPPTPSFGGSLPSPQGFDTQQNRGEPAKKRRKFNNLGLTPRKEEHESSEGEADEEALLVQNGQRFQFEYKGRISTLKTPAEMAAWIEERKKRYPTKERVEQKLREEAERRVSAQDHQGQRDQRSFSKAHKLSNKQGRRTTPRDGQSTPGNPNFHKVSHIVKYNDKRRVRVQENTADVKSNYSSTRDAPESRTGYVEQRLDTAVNDERNMDAGNQACEVLPSTVESDSESDSSETSTESSSLKSSLSHTSDTSSDDGPEEKSSAANLSRSKQVLATNDGPRFRVPCKYFQRGHCKRRADCNFRHDVKTGTRSSATRITRQRELGRKTLRQRFMEQEDCEREQTALEFIRFLGRKGLLKLSEESDGKSNHRSS